MRNDAAIKTRFHLDRIQRNLIDSDHGRQEDPRYSDARHMGAFGSAAESSERLYQPSCFSSPGSLHDLSSSDSRLARQIRERSLRIGDSTWPLGTRTAMTEFSQLRTSAGYEILDVVDNFGAGYADVARWESGAESPPPSILRALQEIGKFTSAASESSVELPRPMETSLGRIENSLLEGDCLKLLKHVPTGSVHLILCDLPYGTTQNRWDSVINLDQLWSEYRRVLKSNGVIVLTSQGIFTAKLILSNEDWFKYKIVWEKSKSTNFLNAKKQPLRKHEDICVFYSKPPTYNPQMRAGTAYDKGVRKNQLSGSYGDFQPAHIRSDGERYPADIVYFKTAESEPERSVWHPTQKPVELGRYLVRTYSNPGDVVLDNAFGSGSFLVAAAMEQRRFIGIERNKEVHLFKNEQIDYVALAADRLAQVGARPHVVRSQ